MSEATQEGGSVELAWVCLSSPPLVSNSRSSNRRRRINPIDLSPRHRIKIFWGGSKYFGADRCAMASFPSQSRGSSNCVRTRFSSLTVEPLMAASRWLHSETDGETQQRPIPTGFLRDMGFLGDASWLNPPLSTVSDDSGPFRQTIRSDSIHSFGIVWIGCADGRGWTLLDSLPGILGCDALPPPRLGAGLGFRGDWKSYPLQLMGRQLPICIRIFFNSGR